MSAATVVLLGVCDGEKAGHWSAELFDDLE
jgi:hypothetical protein